MKESFVVRGYLICTVNPYFSQPPTADSFYRPETVCMGIIVSAGHFFKWNMLEKQVKSHKATEGLVYRKSCCCKI